MGRNNLLEQTTYTVVGLVRLHLRGPSQIRGKYEFNFKLLSELPADDI